MMNSESVLDLIDNIEDEPQQEAPPPQPNADLLQQVTTAPPQVTPPVVHKKRPGRPPKHVETKQQPKYGIVAKPAIAGHILELVYSSPKMFKQIWNVFKQYQTINVDWLFMPDHLFLWGKDRVGKITLFIRIDPKFMNLYYCTQPIHFQIGYDKFAMVTDEIDTSHYRITLYATQRGYMQSIAVTLNESVLEKTSHYDVALTFVPPTVITQHTPLPFDPIMTFRFSAKVLRANMARFWKNKVIQYYIEKSGDDPLTIIPQGGVTTAVRSERYPDAGIHLVHRIQPGGHFNISVSTSHTKSIAAAAGTNDVIISVDKNKIQYDTILERDTTSGTPIASVTVVTEIRELPSPAALM